MLADFEVNVQDATALLTSKLVFNLPFKPRKIEVLNLSNSARPVLYWDEVMATVTGTEEGRMEKGSGATATARTSEDLTTDEGLVVAEGGTTVKYNNPVTPTYQDEDGTAITAGSVFGGEGEDWLARFLPALATGKSDNYANARYNVYTAALALNANNGEMRGDGEEIVLRAWM